jgi:hypothetical protein
MCLVSFQFDILKTALTPYTGAFITWNRAETHIGINMSDVKTEAVDVRLPDGNIKKYEKGVTPRAVAKSIGSRLAKDAVWAEINQRPVGLDQPIADRGPSASDRDAV